MERKGMRNMDNDKQKMMAPPDMCDSSDESCEMPEMPEDFDGSEARAPSEMQGGMGGGFRGGEMMGQESGSASNTWHPAAYLGIGAGSVVLGILVSYACFSKFFHDKPGQTFSTLNKFIWFIVVAILIAAGICVLGYFIPVWTS